MRDQTFMLSPQAERNGFRRSGSISILEACSRMGCEAYRDIRMGASFSWKDACERLPWRQVSVGGAVADSSAVHVTVVPRSVF